MQYVTALFHKLINFPLLWKKRKKKKNLKKGFQLSSAAEEESFSSSKVVLGRQLRDKEGYRDDSCGKITFLLTLIYYKLN